ncbi:MAG: adenylate/guanylate cyclase domain-containing protein [Deltaproteobacteria bacterium]|nr:adenylate/guanylate cyclase domain-containing protein [Deltaproteobacteria bacterium]
MSRTTSTLAGLRLWQRIHVRLTAVYGLALLLVLTPAAVFVYHLAVDAELANLWSRLRLTAVSLAGLVDADRLAAIDAADDPYRVELVRRFTAIIEREPELASIYVFARTPDPRRLRFLVDTDVRAAPAAFGDLYDATRYDNMIAGFDHPAVDHDPVPDAWGVSISGFAPIRPSGGGPARALLGVDVDAARVDRMKARLLGVAAATYAGALALLVLASLGVARLLRRPMARIVSGTEAIAAGDLTARVAIDRDDELGVLGRHFDAMAAGLEERDFIRATFGRYVSEDVARKLLANRTGGGLAGEERRVTVLISDLRGYTRLSEHLEPPQILALMNQYLEAMNDVIDAHGGCVIEFLGDGILVVFGAPDALPDHAERATRCALAMRARLDALNDAWEGDGTAELWQARGVPRLSARIGVHTGAVVAGSLGSRVRLKYAVLGDTVNLAARLEAMNTALATDILVSQDVHDALPAELRARATPHGAQAVKGREQQVAVYSL